MIFAVVLGLVMTQILYRKKINDVGAENFTKITANVQKRWSRPRWATLFWAFFPGMAYIFILQKIVAQRDRLHLFCTFPAILVKYSAPTSSNFFLCKIWTMTNSKSAANITWWVWWMRNRGLLLTFFGPFLTPLDALTHSAVCSGAKPISLSCCQTELWLWSVH